MARPCPKDSAGNQGTSDQTRYSCTDRDVKKAVSSSSTKTKRWTGARTPIASRIPLASLSRRRGNTDTVKLLMLGYRQELAREFTLFNCFGCNLNVLSSFTALAGSYGIGIGFTYGGPVVMTWGWVVVMLLTLSVGLSLAELASAYPTSGALYYWVYMLAPAPIRNLVCFLSAWVLILGQAALTASATFTFVQLVEAAIEQQYGMEVSSVQRLGILLAALLVLTALNSGSARVTAFLTTLGALWHLIALFGMCFAMLMLAPKRQTAKYIFTSWQSDTELTGVTNPVYSTLIGVLMVVWTFTGYDGAAHVAEETLGAELAVPTAIISSIVGAGVTGFLLTVTIIAVKVDESIVFDPTGGTNLVLQVLTPMLENTSSHFGSSGALFSIPIVGSFFCSFQAIANNSRMLYAFARDGGVLLYQFARRVHPRKRAPVWAAAYMASMAAMLSIPMCFNTFVFPVVTSFAVLAIYTAYLVPVTCKLIAGRRKFIPGPFHLRPLLSTANNVVTVVWVVVVMVLSSLPGSFPVTAENCNWSAPMLLGVVGMLLAWYYSPVYGARRWFRGPRTTLGQFHDVLPSELALAASGKLDPHDPIPTSLDPELAEVVGTVKGVEGKATVLSTSGKVASGGSGGGGGGGATSALGYGDAGGEQIADLTPRNSRGTVNKATCVGDGDSTAGGRVAVSSSVAAVAAVKQGRSRETTSSALDATSAAGQRALLCSFSQMELTFGGGGGDGNQGESERDDGDATTAGAVRRGGGGGGLGGRVMSHCMGTAGITFKPHGTPFTPIGAPALGKFVSGGGGGGSADGGGRFYSASNTCQVSAIDPQLLASLDGPRARGAEARRLSTCAGFFWQDYARHGGGSSVYGGGGGDSSVRGAGGGGSNTYRRGGAGGSSGLGSQSGGPPFSLLRSLLIPQGDGAGRLAPSPADTRGNGPQRGTTAAMQYEGRWSSPLAAAIALRERLNGGAGRLVRRLSSGPHNVATTTTTTAAAAMVEQQWGLALLTGSGSLLRNELKRAATADEASNPLDPPHASLLTTTSGTLGILRKHPYRHTRRNRPRQFSGSRDAEGDRGEKETERHSQSQLLALAHQWRRSGMNGGSSGGGGDGGHPAGVCILATAADVRLLTERRAAVAAAATAASTVTSGSYMTYGNVDKVASPLQTTSRYPAGTVNVVTLTPLLGASTGGLSVGGGGGGSVAASGAGSTRHSLAHLSAANSLLALPTGAGTVAGGGDSLLWDS